MGVPWHREIECSVIQAVHRPQAQASWVATHAPPRLHPPLGRRAQWLAPGWPKVAWPWKHGTHPPPFPPRLQGLLTLFAKSFASFNHSTCALSVPCRYSSLQGIHPALQTAVPSHSTRGRGRLPSGGPWARWAYGTVSLCCGPFQGTSWPTARPGNSHPFHYPQHHIEPAIADRTGRSPRGGATPLCGGEHHSR